MGNQSACQNVTENFPQRGNILGIHYDNSSIYFIYDGITLYDSGYCYTVS